MGGQPTYEQLKKKIQELEEKIAVIKLTDNHKRKLDAQLQKNFASSIAHDFNNLLMAIQANVSLMLLDMDPSNAHHERLLNIEKHIQSGARLTSRLLIQAKEEQFELKMINLNQVVEETISNLCRVRTGVVVHQELDDELFLIKANSNQIEQMLFNLIVFLTNDAGNGGELSIKTANTDYLHMKGKKYEPKPGNYVVLTVVTHGRYINQDLIDHIFDPLLAPLEKKQHADLSLASIYATIKSYGGYIDAEAIEGVGTRFNIYQPATDLKITKLIEKTEEFKKEKGTILLVDDEDAFLEVGRELLEAMGYNVISARNGKEAVTLFKENSAIIGLIILDIVMPIMGGSEAYNHLKKINPKVKILVASGYSIDGEASELLRRGCDGFIQKPFKMNELSQKITEIITAE